MAWGPVRSLAVPALLVGALLLAGALAAGGCGGEDGADEAALEQARREGAQQARQQQRIRELEQEVREAKKAQATPVPAAGAVPAGGSAVPSSSPVSPYISTYVPYSPAEPGYDDYVAEVPSGGGWSGPVESFPTGGGLLRSTFRGPDGTLVLIDYTPDEVPALGGSFDNVQSGPETNFGTATTYVFSQSERLPECNGRPCVDIFINDGSGGGWAVLGGGPSLAVAQAIAEHVAQSIRYG